MGNIFEKFSMKNQAAIVTGGAGLLGKQFCKTLAEAGAGVTVADLSIDKAEEVLRLEDKKDYNYIIDWEEL